MAKMITRAESLRLLAESSRLPHWELAQLLGVGADIFSDYVCGRLQVPDCVVESAEALSRQWGGRRGRVPVVRFGGPRPTFKARRKR